MVIRTYKDFPGGKYMENHSGYIMFELLVAIALVGLMVGITCTHVGAYQYNGIKQQVALFALQWHQLRQAAMTRNKQQEMFLDESGHRYQLDGIWYELPPTIRFGFLPDAKGPPSHPNTLIHSAITFVQKKVTCFPDGTIQAGTVYLVDDKKSCMYALTSGVAAVSFLRKYRYDGTWHGY